MTTEYCLALCTCPSAESAAELAEVLIGEQRAACVNIVPGLTSVYPWKGKIETSQEHLLLIKTEAAVFTELEAAIKAHHPYELPEIIAVPIVRGSADYLEWLSACLHRTPS